MARRKTLAIPNTEEFLKNKDISDMLYAGILLRGKKEGSYTYISKKDKKICVELGIDYYRTYKKRIAALVDGGYLENYEDRYRVVFRTKNNYSKFVYGEIIEKLYDTKIDNLIKVYVRLSWLYYLKKDEAWFTYNSLLEAIGYNHYKNTRNRNKMKAMIEKLEEIGLLKCERIVDKRNPKMIKFRVVKIL